MKGHVLSDAEHDDDEDREPKSAPRHVVVAPPHEVEPDDRNDAGSPEPVPNSPAHGAHPCTTVGGRLASSRAFA